MVIIIGRVLLLCMISGMRKLTRMLPRCGIMGLARGLYGSIRPVLLTRCVCKHIQRSCRRSRRAKHARRWW